MLNFYTRLYEAIWEIDDDFEFKIINFHIIPQVSQAVSVMNFKSIHVGDVSANLITNDFCNTPHLGDALRANLGLKVGIIIFYQGLKVDFL